MTEIQPQGAYSAYYMLGFKHKFTFFLRTVPDIADYLLLIEEILRLFLYQLSQGIVYV